MPNLQRGAPCLNFAHFSMQFYIQATQGILGDSRQTHFTSMAQWPPPPPNTPLRIAQNALQVAGCDYPKFTL